MPDHSVIQTNFNRIREKIAQACQSAGRESADVTLLAVSKFQPVAHMNDALACGHLHFGENYVQELCTKMDDPGLATARFHMIGSLQRNKVRFIAGRCALIQTVDRPSLVEALADVMRKKENLSAPQDCLIQINLASEPQKAGCTVDDLPILLNAFSSHASHLRCVGLMVIPPATKNADESRPYFRRAHQLFQQLKQRPGVEPLHLSMGMSQDFEVAIQEGATIVRVGTALFGPRIKTQE